MKDVHSVVATRKGKGRQGAAGGASSAEARQVPLVLESVEKYEVALSRLAKATAGFRVQLTKTTTDARVFHMDERALRTATAIRS